MGDSYMKYWKGISKTIKENQFGTMNNNGYVPDSIEITKSEYENYVNSLPTPNPPIESDIDKIIKHAKKQGWII